MGRKKARTTRKKATTTREHEIKTSIMVGKASQNLQPYPGSLAAVRPREAADDIVFIRPEEWETFDTGRRLALAEEAGPHPLFQGVLMLLFLFVFYVIVRRFSSDSPRKPV